MCPAHVVNARWVGPLHYPLRYGRHSLRTMLGQGVSQAWVLGTSLDHGRARSLNLAAVQDPHPMLMQYKRSAVPNRHDLWGSPEAPDLRVLFIDSNSDRAQLTLRAMMQHVPGFGGDVVSGFRPASTLLSATRYDCVVVHQRLLDDERCGLQSLRCGDDCPVPPVVVLGERTDCADAVLAMQAGAADFLAERTLTCDRLHAAIRSAVHRSGLDATLAQQNIALQHENRFLARKQELLAWGRSGELQAAIASMARLDPEETSNAQAVQPVALEPLINDVLDRLSLQAALNAIHFGCVIDQQVQCVAAAKYELQGILIQLLTQMVRACSTSGNILVLAEPDVRQKDQVKLTLRAQLGGQGSDALGFLDSHSEAPGDAAPVNARRLPGGLILETRIDTDLEFSFSLPATWATEDSAPWGHLTDE